MFRRSSWRCRAKDRDREDIVEISRGALGDDLTRCEIVRPAFDEKQPEFPEAARYGILGKIARVIEPETEADPAAIFTHLLVAFGNYVGRKAFFQVGQTKHHTNLFACIIGRSSRARKGMSCDYVQELFKLVDRFIARNSEAGYRPARG